MKSLLSLLFILQFIDSDSFIHQPYLKLSSKQFPLRMSKTPNNSNIMLKNNTNTTFNGNRTHVYKMSYKNEEEEMFEPRYMFGLSEYDMIILRIYVNIIVTIYFVGLYIIGLKK